MNVTATDAATGKITASDSIPLTITGTAAAETISFTPTQATATVSSPGQSGTATLNVTGNYTGGKIAFTCMLATAPSGAATAYNPACSVAGLTTANGVAATTATFTTTAPTSSALSYPKTNQQEGTGTRLRGALLWLAFSLRDTGETAWMEVHARIAGVPSNNGWCWLRWRQQ